MRPFHEILVEQCMSLFLTAVEDELSDLSQMGFRLLAVVLIGRPRPEGFLIQLYLFRISTAIHHASQMGIANGQGFEPMSSRFVVPQPE